MCATTALKFLLLPTRFLSFRVSYTLAFQFFSSYCTLVSFRNLQRTSFYVQITCPLLLILINKILIFAVVRIPLSQPLLSPHDNVLVWRVLWKKDAPHLGGNEWTQRKRRTLVLAPCTSSLTGWGLSQGQSGSVTMEPGSSFSGEGSVREPAHSNSWLYFLLII